MTVKNTWWRTYYSEPDRPLGPRHSKWAVNKAEDEWNLEFDRCTRMPGTFKEECHNVARLIGEQAESPINVLMSGGKDSEVVARSFLDVGVPFQATLFRFGNMNAHDLVYAEHFCKKFNVPYEIKDFDLFAYYKQPGIHRHYNTYDRANAYAEWMWMISHCEGTIIGGNGMLMEYLYELPKGVELTRYGRGCDSLYGANMYDSRLVNKSDEKGDGWYLGYSEREGDTIENYMHHFGIDGTFKFFNYTPELALSILLDSVVNGLTRTQAAFGGLMAVFKNEFFCKHWPDLVQRPKYTGYEHIYPTDQYKEFKAKHRETMELGAIPQKRIPYLELIQNLMPE